MTDSGFCSYTNPSRATIPLIRPHQCDSEGGHIRGVLKHSNQGRGTRANISNAKISDVRLKGTRLSGQRLIGMRPNGMRPDGMRPDGMRPNGMRPNGMRLKGYDSRERGLKECDPTE